MKNSAFAMDEDLQKSSSSAVKKTTEAFKVSIYCNLQQFEYCIMYNPCHMGKRIGGLK